MGIGETRKILSIILAVLTAVTVALTAMLALMNTTLANRTFLQKNIVNEALVQACNEQLDAKFAVLEAETGIPVRVFQAIKEDNPVDVTLNMAFQNAFGAEDSSFYNDNMVSYFYQLCEGYLKESNTLYTEEEVAVAADKAAAIFSETVGLHEVDYVNTKLITMRRSVSVCLAAGAIGLVLCAVLTLMLYTDKNKAMTYLCYGTAGGALGMLLGSIGCLIAKVPSGLNLAPSIYADAAGKLIQKYFLYTAGTGLLLLVIAYAALFFFNRQKNARPKRR